MGICYFTTPRPLKGCINDVAAMRTFLNQTYGFPLEACLFLTDDSTDPMWSPTRRNILWGLQWLMHEAGPGDSLVFHFSGHGGQRATTNFADEPDGFDETILPVDHLTAGEILDDEMNEILVQGAPEGVKVTAIMDCCHSGSILDLMYSYDFPGTVAGSSFGPSVNTAIGDEVKQGSEGRPGIPMVSGQLANFSSKAPASLSTSVTCFSASVDGQESADTWLIGLPSGALSLGMISVLVENPFGMTVAEVYWKLRRWLEERGKRQTVMVSTSSYRDLNTEVFSF